jgi:hypothetical protein
MRYNVSLLKSILHGRLDLAQALNVRVIGLEDAAEAFKRFNSGEPVKYVFDPHGTLRKFLSDQQRGGTAGQQTGTTTTGTGGGASSPTFKETQQLGTEARK